MDECTCHLGHPPCGYCVEGSDIFQGAVQLAKELNDVELERMREAVERLMDARGLNPPPRPQQAPIVIASATGDGLTAEQRVSRMKQSLKVIGLRGKTQKALVKAMAIPSDHVQWGAFDATDRAYYDLTTLGRQGEGALWDNRCSRRA